jgi:hypothetical protein
VIRYSSLPGNKPDYTTATAEEVAKAELDELRANCDWANVSLVEKSQMAALAARLPGSRYAKVAKQSRKRAGA